MRIDLLIGVLMSIWLAACSTTSPGGPGGSESPPLPKATLGSEQRRLAELFRGTPVVFEMQRDGSLRIVVPLTFAFDKGRSVVKPPLAKVLDLVARSQRTESTRFTVAAPTDPQSKALLLATERANSTRDYLISRGIAPTRFSASAVNTGEDVVLVVADSALH